MRKLLLALVLSAPIAFAARADDTKGPSITDVRPSVKGSNVTVEARLTDETGVLSATVHHRGKGGRVEDTAMQKNEFDDVFKATFPGGADTEFWIEANDLLGNASSYGSSSKAYAANGKPAGKQTAVAAREPAPEKTKPEPRAEARPEPRAAPEPRPEHETQKHHGHHEGAKAHAKASEPPVIEHRKPSAQPPEGQDFTVRMKIHSDTPLAIAVMQLRAQGTTAFTNTPLTHTEGDSYEGKIPAAAARGTVEYVLTVKNEAGATRLMDGDAKTPFTITFKPSSSASADASQGAGPFRFSHWTLFRVAPGQPILVRAQIVSSADDSVPGTAVVLYRGNDGQDLDVAMTSDRTGGWGGFKATLPAQAEGSIFYQIVACDDAGAKCGADTGSKKRWHGTLVSSQPGGALPLPLEAVSSRAPAGLE